MIQLGALQVLNKPVVYKKTNCSCVALTIIQAPQTGDIPQYKVRLKKF